MKNDVGTSGCDSEVKGFSQLNGAPHLLLKVENIVSAAIIKLFVKTRAAGGPTNSRSRTAYDIIMPPPLIGGGIKR